MRTKKYTLFSLLVIAVLSLALSGCQAPQPGAADTVAQPVQDAAPAQPAQQQLTVVVNQPQDATPPTIALPQTQQLVAFYASNECGYTEFQAEFQVTDDAGLDKVLVDYRLRPFSNETTTNTLPATPGEGGYQFALPIADIGPMALNGDAGLLEYSVVAIDNAGNKTRFPQDGWVQVVVAPCTEEIAAWIKGQSNGNAMAAGNNAQGAPWGNGNPMVCPPNCFDNNNATGFGFCILNPTDPSCASSMNAGGGMNNNASNGASGGNAGSGMSGGSGSGNTAGGSSAGNTSGSSSSGSSNAGNTSGGSSSGGSNAGNTSGSSSSGSSNAGNSSGGSSSGGGDTATIDPCVTNPSDPSCNVGYFDSGSSGGNDNGLVLGDGTGGSGSDLADPCAVNPSDPSCTTTLDTGNTVNEPIVTPIVNP